MSISFEKSSLAADGLSETGHGACDAKSLAITTPCSKHDKNHFIMSGVPESFSASQDQAEFCRPVAAPGIELYRAHIVHHAFEPHTHQAFGLGVIESGVERFRYAGSDHLAPPGALVMMNPDELHTGQAETEAGWRYRMIYLEPSIVEQFSCETGWYFKQAVHVDPSRAAMIAGLLDQFWVVQEPLAWQSLMFELLAQFRPYARVGQSAPDTGAPRFNQVLDYLRSHLAERLSLAELAAIADLSPYHFLRCFQKYYHVTPQQMLMSMRLFEAKQLLAAGVPAAQVAASTGLTDQAHLTRAFQKRYGVTPARYQKQLSGAKSLFEPDS